MQIKQDPISGLYCRSDGAVLMPPTGYKYKTFRWTSGSNDKNGYKQLRFHGKMYLVHRIVCRAFNGLAPISKPEVDHINRIKHDNRPENLHWVDHKENQDNKDYVDQSIMKYKVRSCENKAAYNKSYEQTQRAKGLTHCKGPDGKWGWYARHK